MKTEELIFKLQENHIKWLSNLTIEEYEESGEEDFNTWLNNEVKKVLK